MSVLCAGLTIAVVNVIKIVQPVDIRWVHSSIVEGTDSKQCIVTVVQKYQVWNVHEEEEEEVEKEEQEEEGHTSSPQTPSP